MLSKIELRWNLFCENTQVHIKFVVLYLCFILYFRINSIRFQGGYESNFTENTIPEFKLPNAVFRKV